MFTELFDRRSSFYSLEREGPGLAWGHMWLCTLYCVQGKGSCQHQIIVQSYTVCGRLAFGGSIHEFLVSVMQAWCSYAGLVTGLYNDLGNFGLRSTFRRKNKNN